MHHKLINLIDKVTFHGLQQFYGSDRLVELLLDEKRGRSTSLKCGNLPVEVHSIDTFQLISYVLLYDFTDIFVYHSSGTPGAGLCGHQTLGSNILSERAISHCCYREPHFADTGLSV